MKSVILTTWVNNPQNLEHQARLFKKFCKEEHEYIAFIDAKPHEDFTNFNNKNIINDLIGACNRVGVKYVVIPPELHYQRDKVIPGANKIEEPHNPASRTALANQCAWNYVKNDIDKYKYICFYQCDMFPIVEFSIADLIQGNSLVYVSQKREGLEYAWDGIFIIDPSTEKATTWELINFEDGWNNGVYTDAGGGTWRLLKEIENKKTIYYFSSLRWADCSFVRGELQEFLKNDPKNEGGKFYAELYEGIILHLRAGGNWDNTKKELYDKRQECFNRLVIKLLSSP